MNLDFQVRVKIININICNILESDFDDSYNYH